MGTPGATDSEAPVEVNFSQGFWLAETVVTQRQWQSLMNTAPWQGRPDVSTDEDSPATYISHHDAVTYCEMLTATAHSAWQLATDWKIALPTEAQWEYACRAGTKTKFSFGENESLLKEYGWCSSRRWFNRLGWPSRFTLVTRRKGPHAVGRKKPNNWGLKDMHGNVWEWCSDWYHDRLVGGCDPVGPVSGERRVNRGGSWSGLEEYCRSADRGSYSPNGRTDDLGFRVAIIPVNPAVRTASRPHVACQGPTKTP